jgi:hypothetical protein
MQATESVIKQVERRGTKDKAQKGISFKNRKGEEYVFDNDEEYETMMEPDHPVPFPDVAVK